MVESSYLSLFTFVSLVISRTCKSMSIVDDFNSMLNSNLILFLQLGKLRFSVLDFHGNFVSISVRNCFGIISHGNSFLLE